MKTRKNSRQGKGKRQCKGTENEKDRVCLINLSFGLGSSERVIGMVGGENREVGRGLATQHLILGPRGKY